MAFIIDRWKIILESQGDTISFRRLIGPKFIGNAISYLAPGPNVGGEPVRAYLLKRDYGIKLSHGLASITIDKVMDFTYPVPFLVGAMLYASVRYEFPLGVISVFLLILFLLLILLAVFYIQTYREKGFFSTFIRLLRLHRMSRFEKLIEKLYHFEQLIIVFFKEHRMVFLKGLGLSLLSGMVTLLQFYLILISLGVDPKLHEVLLMLVFMILAFFIPIPAGLGSFEVSQSVIFAAFGHPASTGIAFTLILRVAEIFKVGIGLMYMSHIGLKYIRRLSENNSDD